MSALYSVHFGSAQRLADEYQPETTDMMHRIYLRREGVLEDIQLFADYPQLAE